MARDGERERERLGERRYREDVEQCQAIVLCFKSFARLCLSNHFKGCVFALDWVEDSGLECRE